MFRCSSSVWATQSNAPAQQWNQPSGSSATVNVNPSNSNVGQNSSMWPPAAGANPGNFNFKFNSSVMGTLELLATSHFSAKQNANLIIIIFAIQQQPLQHHYSHHKFLTQSWADRTYATSPEIKWILEMPILVIFVCRMGKFFSWTVLFSQFSFKSISNVSNLPFLTHSPHFNIPMAHPRDPTRDLLREISRDVRGDLRGISGKRLNSL